MTLLFGFRLMLMIASNRDHHQRKANQGSPCSPELVAERPVEEIEGGLRHHPADGKV